MGQRLSCWHNAFQFHTNFIKCHPNPRRLYLSAWLSTFFNGLFLLFFYALFSFHDFISHRDENNESRFHLGGRIYIKTNNLMLATGQFSNWCTSIEFDWSVLRRFFFLVFVSILRNGIISIENRNSICLCFSAIVLPNQIECLWKNDRFNLDNCFGDLFLCSNCSRCFTSQNQSQ